MKSYDNKEETKTTVVSEPQVTYGSAQPSMPLPYQNMNNMPKGYMSLECFGELFHQKLDACYAQLQSDSK